MTYSEIKDSVTGILGWLDKNDEAGWEAEIDLGAQSRSDMEHMARPTVITGGTKQEARTQS